MDVDEQREQSAEANNVNITVTGQDIASSSRRELNGNANKTSSFNASNGEVRSSSAVADTQPSCETIVMADIHHNESDGSQEDQLEHRVHDANINDEDRQNEEQIENAGIDPTYPLVLVQRISIPSPENVPRGQSSTESNIEDHLPMEEDNNLEGPAEQVHTAIDAILAAANYIDGLPAAQAQIVNVNEEDNQNEQHIENAGIDPNYPLVLVRRVSIPSASEIPRAESLAENNEDPIAMEDDNSVAGAAAAEGGDGEDNRRPSPAQVIAMLNSISVIESNSELIEGEDDEEDAVVEADEDADDAWSEEEEDEAAFLENPNFRGFANQFEAIRTMITHTRRSMAEAEANFGPVPRNSLMQRFRRILFILNHRRRRLIRLGLAAPDVVLSGGEANAEQGGANEDTSSNHDAETAENTANEDGNNLTMEQEEELNENAILFDTNLPAEHTYMGSNMNRVSGVNYLEVDQYVKVRLFIHQHVLFPGEVLPFMVDSSTTIIEGDIDAQNGILFGVCFPSLSVNKPMASGDGNGSSSEDKDQLLYGVTCQIYELGEDDHSNTLIKSRALQRFVTKASDLTVPLEYINAHPRMKCYGYVKILPDIYLPDPLKSINMGSMNRFRANASMQDMYKRFQAATTPWPAYVYETHNILNIIEKARTQLAQHKIDTMPSDPTQLSYWLVRNLHLPEDMIKSVFLANTVNTRLKLIASTFKKESIFSCRNCVIHIADCRELFAMSKHGVQSQYCNSAGYIHETNTLYQVNRQNILYSGLPSTKFSWFPGYQWHIIVCKICKHHLGWEFKAVKPNLIPKQFYGISSSSVRVRLAEDRNDVPAQNAVYVNLLRLMNAGMNELREARNNMPNI